MLWVGFAVSGVWVWVYIAVSVGVGVYSCEWGGNMC